MRRKRKNYRFYFLIIILISLFAFTLYKGIIFLSDNKIERQLKKLNYNNESILLIIENKLDDYLIKNKIYSKTLETALIKGNFIRENLDLYVNLEYKEYEKYITHLNSLKEIGYKNDELNIIFQHLTPEEIDVLINKEEIITDLTHYITNQYFNIDNLDRYITYKNNNYNYNYEQVINYVNINLDYDFYQKTIMIDDPSNILVLVNKYYKLDKNYVPSKLVSIIPQCSIRSDILTIPIVKEAFEEMCTDMRSINLSIKVVSAYRSYETQQTLYNDYVAKNGVAVADTFSARPGHSEHQTGLALDVYNTVLPFTDFEKTLEFTWIKNNAHKYGFIIRYPFNKEHITGYKYEPWHLRYVGEEVATYIYENNITFDEYYVKNLYQRN